MPSKSTAAAEKATIQFGTEQFVAATTRAEGIPDHAIQIEGPLIHVGKKNLAGWGVTAAAVEQFIADLPGVPIRACPAQDPHACDYEFDNRSQVGYGVRAWLKGDWVYAAAAITDRDAVKKLEDGTWTPFGKGGWSVVGYPSKPVNDFRVSGLAAGFQPMGIALVQTTPTTRPAFVGSGFEMVAAAVNYNHQGGTMTETNKADGEPKSPVTYTQAELDAKLAEATSDLDAKLAALETEKVDAAAVAEQHGVDALIDAKKEFDAKMEAMSAESKATYDTKIAEMTPTVNVEKMIAAAVTDASTQTKTDLLDTIERQKLTGTYKELLTASKVLRAPYMEGEAIDAEKLDARLAEVGTMQVAAISELIERDRMVAAAAPGKSAFETMPVRSATNAASFNAKARALGVTSVEFSGGR